MIEFQPFMKSRIRPGVLVLVLLIGVLLSGAAVLPASPREQQATAPIIIDVDLEQQAAVLHPELLGQIIGTPQVKALSPNSDQAATARVAGYLRSIGEPDS